VTAKKLIYIPHNKRQLHYSQTMVQMNSDPCDTKGLWFPDIAVVVAFGKFSK